MLNKRLLLSCIFLFSISSISCTNEVNNLLIQENEQFKSLNLIERQGSSSVSVRNFAQVNKFLYRGGVPDEFAMKQLKKIGIKTIVNLRGASNSEISQEKEEKEVASKMSFNYINIPVSYEKPITRTMIKKFFDIANDEKNQPLYIHCYHGRDRTGAMVALYKIKFEGISGKSALEEMKKFGFEPKDFPVLADQVLNSTASNLP